VAGADDEVVTAKQRAKAKNTRRKEHRAMTGDDTATEDSEEE